MRNQTNTNKHHYNKIVKYSFRIFIISLLIILVGCTNQESTKMKNSSPQELSCLDTGCPGEEECVNEECIPPKCASCQYVEDHICKDYECCSGTECDKSESCTNNKCIKLECTECQYLQNHKCVDFECCDDSDCDDGDIKTNDYCKGSPKTCISFFVSECLDNDMYCPPFCSNSDDNDCKDNYYDFKSTSYNYEFKYPDDWVKSESSETKVIFFLAPDSSEAIKIELIYTNKSREALENFSEWYLEDSLTFLKSKERVNINGNDYSKMHFSSNYAYYYHEGQGVTTKLDLYQYILPLEDRSYFVSHYKYATSELPDSISDHMLNSFTVMEFDKNQRITKPFLWKINGTTDSYLFGTYHSTDNRIMNLPLFFNETLNKTDVVYTEVIDTALVAEQMLEMGKLKEGNLSSILPEDLYNRTSDYLLKKGLFIGAYEEFKVWVLTLLLAESGAGAQSDREIILDEYISALAVKYEKEIGGLESVEDQLNIFDSLTTEEQIYFLNLSLTGYEIYDKSGNHFQVNMFDEYMKGNEAIFGQIIEFEFDPEDEVLMKIKEKIFDSRNKKMAEKIMKKIEKNPNMSYMFAVGVGHYSGEGNVIDILEENGYIITRVTE